MSKKPAKKTSKPTSSRKSTDSEDDDIDTIIADIETPTINKAEFENIIKKHLKQQENNLKGLIKSENALLKSEITNLQNEIETLKTENSNIKKQADINKSNYESLKGENATLKNKIAKLEEGQLKLAEEIEECTNRQLRKTLVFRGIPEEPVSKTSGSSETRLENWKETEEILAKKIAELCDETQLHEARNMLERVHRAAPNPNYKGAAPPSNFCCFLQLERLGVCQEPIPSQQ